MKRYYAEATKSSPSIDFLPEANRLLVSGQSYPENAFKFYEPVLEWMDEYLTQLSADELVTAEFQIPYMNTSSTKCLMMLLDKLEGAYKSGKRITVRWICNRDNESEFECAQELKEDLTLPFDIIAKEDQ